MFKCVLGCFGEKYLIFTICETFKWIKLLVVELPKDGLQINVKISLGK